MEDTFVVSAQSPLQCSLIASHPVDVPLYVEGGFTTWLRDQPLTYFVLRGEQSDTYKAAAQTIKEADTSGKGIIAVFSNDGYKFSLPILVIHI